LPDYHFTGAYPRVLTGLSQGVNAWLTPTEGEAPPAGSTIEAAPGDALHTNEPYPHAELTEAAPVADVPGEPAEAPAPVVEAPADPAPDAMTAEGAPAPAEPTA
jgi:hypothetical protein